MPSTLPTVEASASEPLPTVWITLIPGGGCGLLLVGDSAPGEDLGQAPIHHLDLAEAAHHDVRRLQVAVDHAAGVRVRHRLADLLEDRQEAGQAVGRVRAALEQVGQRLAL